MFADTWDTARSKVHVSFFCINKSSKCITKKQRIYEKIIFCSVFNCLHNLQQFTGFDRERFGNTVDFSFDITPVEPKPVLAEILEK